MIEAMKFAFRVLIFVIIVVIIPDILFTVMDEKIAMRISLLIITPYVAYVVHRTFNDWGRSV